MAAFRSAAPLAYSPLRSRATPRMPRYLARLGASRTASSSRTRAASLSPRWSTALACWKAHSACWPRAETGKTTATMIAAIVGTRRYCTARGWLISENLPVYSSSVILSAAKDLVDSASTPDSFAAAQDDGCLLLAAHAAGGAVHAGPKRVLAVAAGADVFQQHAQIGPDRLVGAVQAPAIDR